MNTRSDLSFLRPSARRVVHPEFFPVLDMIIAHGKHVRPWLGVRLCRVLGVDPSPLHDAFTALELIHGASLVHDDIVDHDLLRRGEKSLHSRVGMHEGLLYGDYFFVSALQLVAQKKYSGRIMETVVQAVKDMTHAQILESERRVDSLEKYWEYAKGKTGALMRACATLPLEYYGLTHATLEEFAGKYGLAFQVADDLADFSNGREEPSLPAFIGREAAQKTMEAMQRELDALGIIPCSELPFIAFEPLSLEEKK